MDHREPRRLSFVIMDHSQSQPSYNPHEDVIEPTPSLTADQLTHLTSTPKRLYWVRDERRAVVNDHSLICGLLGKDPFFENRKIGRWLADRVPPTIERYRIKLAPLR